MLWPFRDYLCQRSTVHSVQYRVVHDQKGDTYEVKVHICDVPIPSYTIEQCCVYECRRKVSDVWHAMPCHAYIRWYATSFCCLTECYWLASVHWRFLCECSIWLRTNLASEFHRVFSQWIALVVLISML